MAETKHFVNDGYGWACRRCREEDDAAQDTSRTDSLPRFFREGEAEERESRLSGRALARWKDESRQALVCGRCGVEEELS